MKAVWVVPNHLHFPQKNHEKQDQPIPSNTLKLVFKNRSSFFKRRRTVLVP